MNREKESGGFPLQTNSTKKTNKQGSGHIFFFFQFFHEVDVMMTVLDKGPWTFN